MLCKLCIDFPIWLLRKIKENENTSIEFALLKTWDNMISSAFFVVIFPNQAKWFNYA